MEMKNDVEQPPLGGEAHFGADIWQKLLRFAELIASEGQLRGLVGPREMDKLWSRHILNSTAILDFLPQNASLIDVGSGAGFPGMIVAIVRPDLKVTLVDSLRRRTEWLSFVCEDLELDNVTIHHKRAEEFVGQLSADFVTARAVAALRKLLPWTMPLVKPGGQLIALKGGRAEQEIDEADKVLHRTEAKWVEVHDVEVWGTDEGTRVVVVQKK